MVKSIIEQARLFDQLCIVDGCARPPQRKTGKCEYHYRKHLQIAHALQHAANPQDDAVLRRCATCRQLKPARCFWRVNGRRSGYFHQCIECARPEANARQAKSRPPRQRKTAIHRHIEPLGPMRIEDAIYMAGFFDGEGCIYIKQGNTAHGVRIHADALRLVIANTHFESIEWCHRVAGCGSLHKGGGRSRLHACQTTWHVGGQDAAHVLRQLLPYLKIKKREAEVALEFQEHVSRYRSIMPLRRAGLPAIDEDEMTWRQAKAVELQDLKRAYKIYRSPVI